MFNAPIKQMTLPMHACVCAHASVQCLIVLIVIYVFMLRLARWCAAEWFATATTPTPTSSAAPSATLDWAASVFTRTASSPTAAGTHGWRTASSASAWWVRDGYTNPFTSSRTPARQEFSRLVLSGYSERAKSTYAFIPAPRCPHMKCNKYSCLHGNAHEWEMCSAKKVKERSFVAK